MKTSLRPLCCVQPEAVMLFDCDISMLFVQEVNHIKLFTKM